MEFNSRWGDRFILRCFESKNLIFIIFYRSNLAIRMIDLQKDMAITPKAKP